MVISVTVCIWVEFPMTKLWTSTYSIPLNLVKTDFVKLCVILWNWPLLHVQHHDQVWHCKTWLRHSLTFCDNVWHFCDTDNLIDFGYMCHCKTLCDVLWRWHNVTLTDLCRDRNLLDDPAHHNRLITETQHRHNLIIHSIYTQVPDNIISFWYWKKYTPYFNGVYIFLFLIYFLAMKKRQVLTDACTI